MSKINAYRILSIVMALLIFVSSIGYAVDVHYCKGQLKSYSIFGKASSCHVAKKVCPHHANMVTTTSSKSDCCKNKTLKIDQIDTEFNIISVAQSLNIPVLINNVFIYIQSSTVFTYLPSNISCLDWHYPIVTMDTYVLLGRFLI